MTPSMERLILSKEYDINSYWFQINNQGDGLGECVKISGNYRFSFGRWLRNRRIYIRRNIGKLLM